MDNVYDVGPDEPYGIEDKAKDYKFVVHWYESEGYEGKGTAACLCHDGTVIYIELGHCSCYGPCDDSWPTGDGVPLAEFLTYDKMDDCIKGRERDPKDYTYERWQAIVPKVRELVEGGKYE